MASDVAFWDRTAAKYAADPIADMAGYERTLTRVAGLLAPGDSVLECGCGTGMTALRLAPRVRAYRATDLSAGMIAIAEDRRAADPVPGLTFDVATVEQVAVAGGPACDVVLGFNWLHLVPDLAATLKAVRAVLKPGGRFITKTTCLRELNPLLPVAIRAMRLFGKAPRTVRVFSAAELEAAMVSAGFSIVAVERHGTGRRDPRVFIVAT